jgi:hypothetical protein
MISQQSLFFARIRGKTLQSAHLSIFPLCYITKNDRMKNTTSVLHKKIETGSIGKALGSF